MKRLLLIITICVLAFPAMAQNRNTIKKMFDEGRFEELKPIVEKQLKKNPKNSEFSYWYAGCCIETGDTADVEELLKFAASRGIVNADRYLGDFYYGRQ